MSVYLIFVVMQPPEERPDDLVDAKYVARRFACSTRSVYMGKCGTGGIVPVTRSPWWAARAQVEEERARLVATVVSPAKPKTRISLIRRKGGARGPRR
jgi:hypothetical protein